MQDNLTDLIYVTRNLCEYLRDRPEGEKEEELQDLLDEVEECLEVCSETTASKDETE